jgi:peptide methionine sulfoxide reductase MsrA
MRQGNDIGTQYRSAIYTTTKPSRSAAQESKAAYGKALAASGLGSITTEIAPAGPFYFAEDYHQQYLAKNPARLLRARRHRRLLSRRNRRYRLRRGFSGAAVRWFRRGCRVFLSRRPAAGTLY